MPSSSADISSSTRSMLTASSNRWWKKHGDCATRVASDVLGLFPRPDMDAARFLEALSLWAGISLEVLEARDLSIVWFGNVPGGKVPLR